MKTQKQNIGKNYKYSRSKNSSSTMFLFEFKCEKSRRKMVGFVAGGAENGRKDRWNYFLSFDTSNDISAFYLHTCKPHTRPAECVDGQTERLSLKWDPQLDPQRVYSRCWKWKHIYLKMKEKSKWAFIWALFSDVLVQLLNCGEKLIAINLFVSVSLENLKS